MIERRYPPVSSEALDAFAVLARRYCQCIEHISSLPPHIAVGTLHHLLPRLYAAALDLPDTEVLFPDDGVEVEEDVPTAPAPNDTWTKEYRAIYAVIDPLFGAHTRYREVFDPYEPDSEKEVTGSLADDFSDIYGDLRDGLLAWDQGDSGQSLWEWRFGFESHWGEHATGALRALHALASWHEGAWPTAPFARQSATYEQ